jgi:hypothetical protein
MDSDQLATADEDGRIFQNPLPALTAGLGFTFISLLLAFVTTGGAVGVPLALGALLTGIGISIKPKEWHVLAITSFNFLMGGVVVLTSQRVFGDAECIDQSALYVLWLGALVSFFAFILMLAPTELRRIVVSMLILFHFVGICTAIISAPPQPWLAEKLWVYVYRPYLQFTYLNNAYHFYAPEPGPASLLWYRVEYEPNPDGTRNYRWVKVPQTVDGQNIEFGPDGEPHTYPQVMFTRRLSLAMSAGQFLQLNGVTLAQLADRRARAGNDKGIPPYPPAVIPMEQQYHEPNGVAKHWIASYARHVAQTYKDTKNPDHKVTGVKVYLVEHRYPAAFEMVEKPDPYGKMIPARRINDPTHYLTYYMGEFDAEGKMKASCFELSVDRMGNNNKYDLSQRDPFLYWMIPILYHGVANYGLNDIPRDDRPVDNFVRKHAGDPNEEWENQPWTNQP